MFNPWVALGMRVFQLGLEAQSVVALRMLRLASGDSRGQDELNRMEDRRFQAILRRLYPGLGERRSE